MNKHREPEEMHVKCGADWDRVNDLLEGFEDGIVKEVWLDGQTWLEPDDTLPQVGYPRLVVIVHLQSSKVRAVRLTFEGVRSVAYDSQHDASPAVAEDQREGWIVKFLSYRIAASSCVVEPLGSEWLGRGPFLGSDQG